MQSDSILPQRDDEIRDLPQEQAVDNTEAEQVKGGIIIIGGRPWIPPASVMPVTELPAKLTV